MKLLHLNYLPLYSRFISLIIFYTSTVKEPLSVSTEQLQIYKYTNVHTIKGKSVSRVWIVSISIHLDHKETVDYCIQKDCLHILSRLNPTQFYSCSFPISKYLLVCSSHRIYTTDTSNAGREHYY